MIAFVVSFFVGVICVAMGVSIRRGNIELLHDYHRNNVLEKDRIPFGRKTGLGLMVVGGAVMLFSLLAALMLRTDCQIFLWAGLAVLAAGIAAGLAICFSAISKYNKEVF